MQFPFLPAEALGPERGRLHDPRKLLNPSFGALAEINGRAGPFSLFLWPLQVASSQYDDIRVHGRWLPTGMLGYSVWGCRVGHD